MNKDTTNNQIGKIFPFGKYENQLIEWVVLKHPEYIALLGNQAKTDAFDSVYDHINKCIGIFDAKPFVKHWCQGKIEDERCTRELAYATIYRQQYTPYFWCDECDPIQLGAGGMYKLTVVRTYNEALAHLSDQNISQSKWCKTILPMAKAKGLAGTVTKKNILAFFHGDQPQGVIKPV